MVAVPPEGYRPRKNLTWCPYCGKETPFAWDGRLNTARCSECGVSVWDFYTRTLNGLSKGSELSRFEARVKASGERYTRPFFWQVRASS